LWRELPLWNSLVQHLNPSAYQTSAKRFLIVGKVGRSIFNDPDIPRLQDDHNAMAGE
jgi:hypothetical protein